MALSYRSLPFWEVMPGVRRLLDIIWELLLMGKRMGGEDLWVRGWSGGREERT